MGAMLLLSAGLAAESPTWKAAGSVSFSEGDYGTGEKSRIVYAPVILRRNFPEGYVEGTLSAVRIANEGEDPASGMGDTLLRAGYHATEEADWLPGVDLVAKIKVPTASESNGLGTGALDGGGGAEAYKWLRYPWVGFLDAYLIFIGPSSRTDESVRWAGDIGVGRQTGDWFHSVFLDGRTAIRDGEDDFVATYYYGSYRISRDWRGFGTLEAGLTDGAPDYAVSVGICRYIFN